MWELLLNVPSGFLPHEIAFRSGSSHSGRSWAARIGDNATYARKLTMDTSPRFFHAVHFQISNWSSSPAILRKSISYIVKTWQFASGHIRTTSFFHPKGGPKEKPSFAPRGAFDIHDILGIPKVQLRPRASCLPRIRCISLDLFCSLNDGQPLLIDMVLPSRKTNTKSSRAPTKTWRKFSPRHDRKTLTMC